MKVQINIIYMQNSLLRKIKQGMMDDIVLICVTQTAQG